MVFCEVFIAKGDVRLKSKLKLISINTVLIIVIKQPANYLSSEITA